MVLIFFIEGRAQILSSWITTNEVGPQFSGCGCRLSWPTSHIDLEKILQLSTQQNLHENGTVPGTKLTPIMT